MTSIYECTISIYFSGHESTDPVVKLAAAVFRLSEIERRAVEAGFKTLLSPEVSCSIMWFLRRWVLTYLAGPENCYSDISHAFLAAFGQNTEGAAWTIGFLLEKIISNLTAMNSEPSVVQDTVKLLVAMVDSKERGRQVLKSPVLNNLAICVQNQGIDALPSEAKRGLLKALTTVTSSCEDQAAKDAHWSKFLQPLIGRYNSLVSNENCLRIDGLITDGLEMKNLLSPKNISSNQRLSIKQKTLISRNFRQKCSRENYLHIFSQKFRESNVFTKELISRNFSFLHAISAVRIFLPFKVFWK